MRKALLFFSFLLCEWGVFAQHGISFYHLRNATFQSTNYNPAFLPAGKFFIGLPALSGVNIYAASPISYSQLFKNSEGQTEFTISNAIQKMPLNGLVALNAEISLFHLGFRFPNKLALYLFANERVDFNTHIPKRMLNWAWEGNAAYVGRRVDFGLLGVTGNYFREYGLGMAFDNTEMRLRFGARVKYYQGLANISTSASLDADVVTFNQNYQLQLDISNFRVRTAGIEVFSGNEGDVVPYMISNGNRGFGIDLGIDKQFGRYSHVSVGISDIGYIHWSEGILNRRLNDTTFFYTGVDLSTRKNLIKTVEDSLVDQFKIRKDVKPFTTVMPTRLMMSYVYSPRSGTDMIYTVGGRVIQGYPRMIYGFGLRQYFGPKFIVSATANKIPGQFINIGAAVSATAGVAQFYLSTDKVLGYNLPNTQWVEARVGLNIVIGSGKPRNKPTREDDDYKDFKAYKTAPKGVKTHTYMGQRVKVKKQEGIYSVIPLQKKSEPTSVTGKTDKGYYLYSNPGSITGTQQTNAKEKSVPLSVTGQTQTNAKENKAVVSKTGKVQTSNKKGSKGRSNPGSGRSKSRMSTQKSGKSVGSVSGKRKNNSRKKG